MATVESKTVVGVFQDRAQAERAVLVLSLGPIVAGGILGAMLASATAGAIGGGLLGALKGMGIPEEDVRHYQQEFDAGRTLVTVNTTDNQQQVMDILRRNGAQNADTGPVQAVTNDPTVGHDTVDPLDRY